MNKYGRFKSYLILIAGTLCIAGIAFMLNFFNPNNKINYPDNTREERQITDRKPSARNSDNGENVYLPPPLPDYAIYEIGEPAEQGDFIYTVTDVHKSKKLMEGIDLNDFGLIPIIGEEIDEAGNIIIDWTYVFLKVKVKNNTPETQERYIHPGLYLQEEDGQVGYFGTYFRDNVVFNDERYYKYIFKPYEEVDFTFGYLVDDKYVNSPYLYLDLSDIFMYQGNPDIEQNYIKINK